MSELNTGIVVDFIWIAFFIAKRFMFQPLWLKLPNPWAFTAAYYVDTSYIFLEVSVDYASFSASHSKTAKRFKINQTQVL